jgi:hypothetical protein
MEIEIDSRLQREANQALDAWFNNIPDREKGAAFVIVSMITSDTVPDIAKRAMFAEAARIWPTFPKDLLLKLAELNVQIQENKKGEPQSKS